ncbi:hypothetical protein CEXT_336751 [Caerostris extrusa]|uniref:Uncharacterized protein n=1 Tax=Caerostris extrusa TaxID=172846 RepID=A0AAV4XS51_CAEEX|nr:hypothetical protein CEXT_336751 [Caerostris extrusa]
MKVLSHFYLFSHPNQLRSTPRTFMFPPYPINAIHLRIGGQVDYPNHSQMLRDPGEEAKCSMDIVFLLFLFDLQLSGTEISATLDITGYDLYLRLITTVTVE